MGYANSFRNFQRKPQSERGRIGGTVGPFLVMLGLAIVLLLVAGPNIKCAFAANNISEMENANIKMEKWKNGKFGIPSFAFYNLHFSLFISQNPPYHRRGGFQTRPSIADHATSYDASTLIPLILEKGEGLQLSPTLEARFLGFHSPTGAGAGTGARPYKENGGRLQGDHVSSYVTVYSMLLPVGEQVLGMPIRLAFNRETWTMDAAGIWTIKQLIATDGDLDGTLDEFHCTELREDDVGRVLSMDDKPCDDQAMTKMAMEIAGLVTNPPRGI